MENEIRVQCEGERAQKDACQTRPKLGHFQSSVDFLFVCTDKVVPTKSPWTKLSQY